MVDAERFMKPLFESLQYAVRNRKRDIVSEIEMRFEMDIFVIQLPEVDVVHIVDLRLRFDSRNHLLYVDSSRGKLHQNRAALPHQTERRPDQIDRDQHRDERIDPEKVKIVHQYAADYDCDTCHNIGQQVQIGGFDVHVFMRILFDQQHTRGVEYDTQQTQSDYP